jgi:hypothetical protein
MRKYFLFILLIISVFVHAQTKTLLPPVGGTNTIYRIAGGAIADTVQYLPSTVGIPTLNMLNYMAAKRAAATQVDTANDIPYWYSPKLNAWYTITGGGGTDTATLDGGAFTTSNVQVGFNPGAHITPKQLLLAVFYGLQPPTATLTGGTTLELTASPTVTQTLNWGAGRQSNTPVLNSIVVAGISQSFSQPAPNSTVTGTQSVNVPANTTTTYSNLVTASLQTAIANTTFNFLGKKYYGLLTDTTGITTGSLNANIIALAGSAFATTKVLATNTGAITGTEFWCYAYPSSLGDLTALSFNSIPALEAMNKITLSITNASGFTQNYLVYYNKQGQTISSDITAQ